jgi:hypothetical protein
MLPLRLETSDAASTTRSLATAMNSIHFVVGLLYSPLCSFLLLFPGHSPFLHSSMTLPFAIQGEERTEAASSWMAYAQPQFPA